MKFFSIFACIFIFLLLCSSSSFASSSLTKLFADLGKLDSGMVKDAIQLYGQYDRTSTKEYEAVLKKGNEFIKKAKELEKNHDKNKKSEMVIKTFEKIVDALEGCRDTGKFCMKNGTISECVARNTTTQCQMVDANIKSPKPCPPVLCLQIKVKQSS